MFEYLPASSCASNIDPQSGTIFLHLVNTLLASQCALKNTNSYPPDSTSRIKDGDHFDFIVVGSGSAGSVVGKRIAEIGKWRVLVLEAGGLPSVTTEIPSLSFKSILGDHIWNYHTQPASGSCLGFKNGTCHWPRGKVLGGCSTINNMLYIRGNKQNYDSWASVGNIGWNYENITKYYRMSEKLLVEDMRHLNSYGKEGLLPLTRYRVNDLTRDVIFDSAKEMGYNVLEEEGPLGFFESLQTIDGGVRANTAKIFLGAVKDSDKLTLSPNTQAMKVIIDKSEREARGVQVKIGDKTLNIFADKEVILSAGAINSPQLLMLSGIGPRKHLQDIGVELIQDLEVGKNLQDHMVMTVFTKLDDKAMESPMLLDEIYKYFAHRKGKFSTVGLMNIQGFVNTRNTSDFADIQLAYSGIAKNHTSSLETYMGVLEMDPEILRVLKNYNTEHNIMCTLIILLQPKSRGEVLLRSSDPFEYPIIRSGYLTDEKSDDIETLLRGIRLVEQQLSTEPFKKLNAEVLDVGIPNCKTFKFNSDDYWRCAVKNIGSTLFHPTSTCKMGPRTDVNAVVDPRLKVHGIKKLRVIDASIMPNIISGNTHAPTIMIGQKGAQMVIEDHDFEQEKL